MPETAPPAAPGPHFDLLIIGAGPAGYVSAIRGAQLGLKVAVAEKEPALGGTCLRIGCIPSKALLHSSELYEQARHDFAEHGIQATGLKLDLAKMMARKNAVVKTLTQGVAGLMKKNKITVLHGAASFDAERRVTVGEQTVTAEHVLIATGSVAAALPGIDLTLDRVDTSTDAIAYDDVPEKLVVIGAGVIGLELGSVWRRLGSRVTVLEYLDRILPGMDSTLAKEALKVFKKQGLEFELGTKVTGVETTATGVKVLREGADPVEADRVLVAVGRKPHTEGLGLEHIGVKPNARGQIEVNERFETSAPGVYAVGDVIPGPMLAHKAEEEGVACVEMIATGHGHLDYHTIASVVYTDPEVASVGKTEDELKEEGVNYKAGRFPFAANGRARAIDAADAGFVTVLADAETDRVLGVHILGHMAGDLIAEAGTAIAYGASSEDIARACHAHPTLSETVKEAALAVDGRAVHI